MTAPHPGATTLSTTITEPGCESFSAHSKYVGMFPFVGVDEDPSTGHALRPPRRVPSAVDASDNVLHACANVVLRDFGVLLGRLP